MARIMKESGTTRWKPDTVEAIRYGVMAASTKDIGRTTKQMAVAG